MPRDVIMPALGVAQETGLVVAWLKKSGDAVKTGDALLEVETEKATMEVEAQADGFLTDVRAAVGEAVPVGQVVAVIAETANAGLSAAPAASLPPSADPSDGQPIIMPALGMAQKTGLIVGWRRALGEAVAADDVLLEVETDKSVTEVPAGHDGFVAAILAETGSEVPVGEVIAVISANKPEARAGAPAPRPRTAPAQPTTPPPAPAKLAERPTPRPAPLLATTGRILASPKARRLAAEAGVDLARLVAQRTPQPYHVADIEALKALPTATEAAKQSAAGARYLSARVPAATLLEFLAWIREETGAAPSSTSVLAGMAASALRAAGRDRALVVAAKTPGRLELYIDPDLIGLGAAPAGDPGETPTLILRDLRTTPVVALRLGAESAPVLSLATDGADLSITLECAPDQLAPQPALDLITGFAGRLAEPLRQLL